MPLTRDAYRGEWVDVRDIALAHALAIQKEAAGGERIIVSGGPYKFPEWSESTIHSCLDEYG